MCVPDWLYEEVADRLKEAIGERRYFSGYISFEARRITCRLTISLIVYRECVAWPEGEFERISDLVPIWWEFHTYKDGDDILNDFQFSEMRKYI